MRLEPVSPDAPRNPIAGTATLDEILAHNAARNGEAPALGRPGEAAPASWREVDASVSALASTFAGWRLGEDAVVGVQLGSSAEAALACLALWRAGLIPAMLPLAWRRREIIAALSTVGASAILTPTRGAGAELAENACEIAAGLDAIRFVGCFGADAPDGATPLDDAAARPADRHVRADRPQDAADHVAVVTFDRGSAPVARSHNELLGAALIPLAAGRLSSQSSLVSTLDLAGLSGLATGLVPWLASSCAAAFHQPSDCEGFSGVVDRSEATHLALPGRVASRLAADGAFDPARLSALMLVWRAPEGRALAVDFGAQATTVDVSMFGELGLYAAARVAPARLAPLPLGPAGPEGFSPLIELRLGQDGRLSIRGAACPSARWPAPAPVSRPVFDEAGFIETGLAGLADRAAGRVSLGGRRRGTIQVGGLAMAASDVEDAYVRSGAGAPVIQDDATFGARIALAPRQDDAGPSREAVAALLATAGFGPALAPVEAAVEPVRRSA